MINSDDALDATLRELAQLKSPVRAQRAKTLRAAILRLLKTPPTALSPEVRLRACLAIGRVPEPALVDPGVLRRALSPEDCGTFAGRLSVRTQAIDASASLSALSALLTDTAEVRLQKISEALRKAMTRWHARRPSLPLTPESVAAYQSVVEQILQRSREKRLAPAKGYPAKFNAGLCQLVAFSLLEAGAIGDGAESAAVSVLLSAQDLVEAEMADLVEARPELESALAGIVGRSLAALAAAASNGDAAALRHLAQRLLRLRITAAATKQSLQGLFEERSRLTPQVQLAIAEVLGIDRPPSTDIDFGAGPDSVMAVQLASALMRAWIASSTTSQAQEAFDELAVVLREFFGIEVKGVIGETATFNSLIHELLGESRAELRRVRVIRPRVEKSEGLLSAVLIKALVEPAI